jgi:hypothetical protein
MFSKTSPDEVPREMLALLVELLASAQLPELAIGGAWHAMYLCLTGRPELAKWAIEELGLFDLGMEHFRAIGSPADVVSISRGSAGRAHTMLFALNDLTRCFAGQVTRPDLEAMVSSGLLDLCLDMVVAFAAAGVEGLQDAEHSVLGVALCIVARCGTQPGCEAKVRSMATALVFCLENSLDFMKGSGGTSGAFAARVCCSVFGRDEGGSELTFTQVEKRAFLAISI